MPDARPELLHRLSMMAGPDEETPPFCECGNWWPCSEAPNQPLEPWERKLAEAIFAEEPHDD